MVRVFVSIPFWFLSLSLVWDLAKEREWDLEKRLGGVFVFLLFVFGFFFVFSVVAVYQSITKI